MDGYLINGSVGLPRGALLRIDDGAGILVYVWEGEVWLTQEGSVKDHMLQAGQWFRLERDGATIAHAFRRSVVSLSASRAGAPAQRIALLREALPPVVLQERPRRSAGAVLRAAWASAQGRLRRGALATLG